MFESLSETSISVRYLDRRAKELIVIGQRLKIGIALISALGAPR